jgi:tetratricopeptide (TPR) repeat protein
VGTCRPADALARGHPAHSVTPELTLQGLAEELSLDLLAERDVARHIAMRFGDEVGARLGRVVHGRTDGLPLFVVNVVDAFLRGGLVVETDGAWEVRGSDADLTTAWPDGTMAARYRFVHVLYQQVLYERLPAARRASLHRRIGEREAEAYRARPAERAGALAVHFERGGVVARAIHYRHQAAQNALRHCAYPEAIEYLTRGRELLDRVPDTGERYALELPLQTTLGPALIALRGEAAPEVEAAYMRARELAEFLDDQTCLFLALWGLWYVNYGRGRYADARKMGDALLQLAERDSDRGRRVEAHHALWATLTAMGASSDAVSHVESGLALYDPALDHAQASLYGGHDAGACGLYHRAVTEWLLGRPDRALATIRDALALAERLAHPMTTIITHLFATAVHYLRGELSEAFASTRAMVALAEAQGALEYLQDGAIVLASFGVRDRQGIVELHRQLSGAQATGRSTWRDVIVLCSLGALAAQLDDAKTGLDLLASIPAEHRGGFFAPKVERVRGALLVVRGDCAQAETCFRRAIEIARERGERSLELRASTSLARLLAGRGQRDEARGVLGPIYGAFTEGFDTADLQAARSLLDGIGGPP